MPWELLTTRIMYVIDTAALLFTACVNKVTQDHKTELVQASCLYSTCRENNLSFLLIDFSNYLGVNIHELALVHLKVSGILKFNDYGCDRMFRVNITEPPNDFEKLIDPSVFLPFFSICLLKGETHDGDVVRRAKEIIATRKSDWIQTGLKFSETCREALHTAAQSYTVKFLETDMEHVLRICREETLDKQLVECLKTEFNFQQHASAHLWSDMPDFDYHFLADLLTPPRGNELLTAHLPQIRFFLQEAVKRAEEAKSLIDTVLAAMKFNQKSQEMLDTAKIDIDKAIIWLDAASIDVVEASFINPAGCEWGWKGKRDTKRKKRTRLINLLPF